MRERQASMSEVQQAQLQTAVQHYFKEWLAETGNLRQITDLVRLEQQQQQLLQQQVQSHGLSSDGLGYVRSLALPTDDSS